MRNSISFGKYGWLWLSKNIGQTRSASGLARCRFRRQFALSGVAQCPGVHIRRRFRHHGSELYFRQFSLFGLGDHGSLFSIQTGWSQPPRWPSFDFADSKNSFWMGQRKQRWAYMGVPEKMFDRDQLEYLEVLLLKTLLFNCKSPYLAEPLCYIHQVTLFWRRT